MKIRQQVEGFGPEEAEARMKRQNHGRTIPLCQRCVNRPSQHSHAESGEHIPRPRCRGTRPGGASSSGRRRSVSSKMDLPAGRSDNLQTVTIRADLVGILYRPLRTKNIHASAQTSVVGQEKQERQGALQGSEHQNARPIQAHACFGASERRHPSSYLPLSNLDLFGPLIDVQCHVRVTANRIGLTSPRRGAAKPSQLERGINQ